MMKLVISFDEMEIDNGFIDNMDSANDKLVEFLQDQFPEWDYEMAFNNNPDWDFDNMECHIQMNVT